MRTHLFLIALLLVTLSNFSYACTATNSEGASSANLTLSISSLNVSEGKGERMLTTLGSIKNSSGACFDTIVVEVKYYDAKQVLIDTITQTMYDLVVPPTQDVAIRIRDAASHPSDAYASQKARIVSANNRAPRISKTPPAKSMLVEILINWAPMLLLIVVWIFFMLSMKGKNSPQSKTIQLIEQQNEILRSQNALLERIASAAERRNESGRST